MVSFNSSCLVSIGPTMATPSWRGEPLLQQVLIDVVTLLVVGSEGSFGSVFLHVALVVWVVVATTKLSGMHDVTKFIKRNYEPNLLDSLYASLGFEL